MPRPRKSLINVDDTPYYHCTSRCVRRAYLCGKDEFTGQSYEHRRRWVEERLLILANVFAIDVCAYAVMSNHTHLVLRINQLQAKTWSTKEVVTRWHQLHKGTKLGLQYLYDSTSLTDTQRTTINAMAHVYRQRLSDISWFMKSLNEYIARRANKEDKCTGHFWEGRFKSQAIVDDIALAATMVYVDLNPIRANMANSLDKSDHTSIKRRIRALKSKRQPNRLLPFVGNHVHAPDQGLPFTLKDYIELVEFTGYIHHPKKRGNIPHHSPSIMSKIGLSPQQWAMITLNIEVHFSTKISSQYITKRLIA